MTPRCAAPACRTGSFARRHSVISESAIHWLSAYGPPILVALGFAVWTVFRAEDPARTAFKWVMTTVVLLFLFLVVAPMVGRGGMDGAFIGIPLTAACSVALAIIWRHELADLVANPIGSLYDGGKTPPDPKPAYSAAQAREKSGKYTEAIAEIRKQLNLFPQDLEGHMMLASIQAEKLGDVEAAENTVMHFCSQPGHAPRSLVFALYSLADWHLAINKDADAARRALEKVIEMLPGTEFEPGARQRIAHLGDPAAMELVAGKMFHVPAGIQNLGLIADMTGGEKSSKPPEELASEYVRHLERHPMDAEIREKLATLYVEHYKRLDLAAAEIEDIIRTPHQRGRVVTHALETLADLQKRSGADYDTIRSTLERIVSHDPRCAAAENARRRIDLLKLELKANTDTQKIHMGSYPQDIGLGTGSGQE